MDEIMASNRTNAAQLVSYSTIIATKALPNELSSDDL
jgi:hypothetical protein